MSGIVVMDIGGGDHMWSIVDDQLWKQITELDYPDTHKGLIDRHEAIHWLVSDTSHEEELIEPPNHSSSLERQGKILKTFFTQTHVIEVESFDNIQGVLVLP